MTRLSIKDLSIAFQHGGNSALVVDHLSLNIEERETLALIGRSGCGKTVTANAIMQLLPKSRVVYPNGDIIFDGKSLLQSPRHNTQQRCHQSIRLIAQQQALSLNPCYTIEKQIYDVISAYQHITTTAARPDIISYLERVGIRRAAHRLSAYPNELSYGERQRVMIAIAIITKPKLLIVDEPMVGLDITAQTQIINLFHALKTELGMSLLVISHNLSFVKKIADNVAVMKKGQLIEYNNRHRILLKPEHDYTRMLFDDPFTEDPVPLPTNSGILMNIHNLSVDITIPKGTLRSQRQRFIDQLNLSLYQGEAIGLIGESGAGKSTAAMAIVKLINATGDIIFDGRRLDHRSERKWRPYRQQIQIVFQDSYSSLNPRLTVAEIISEGLVIAKNKSKQAIEKLVKRIMLDVGLDPQKRHYYSHQFSNGEQQRIAIARALVVKPRLLILDDPTSSLDHTTKKQLITLLKSLQKNNQLSYLLISHDIGLIHSFCHQIVVIHEGKVIEHGSRDMIFNSPTNQYTKQLLSAMPTWKTATTTKNKREKDNTNWNEALLFGTTHHNTF